MTATKTFSGPDIGVLLEQVQGEFGDAAVVVAANRCRSGGFAGFFATESFEVIVEIPTEPAAAAPRRGRLARRAETRDASARPVGALEALIVAADEAERQGVEPPASRPSVESVGSRDPGDSDDFGDVLRRISSVRTQGTRRPFFRRTGTRDDERVIDLAALERAGLMPSLNPSVASVGDGRSALAPLRWGGDVATSSLLALGVPNSLLSSAENGRISLAGVIHRLPAPPPMITGHGAMIAFVGEASIVLDVARAVSVALHQDPDACVFLSPCARPVGFVGEQISVIDDLARRREEWSSLDRLTIVAIDIGFARQDVAWGRQAVSMLRPAMRWGVVAATRKADDIRAWSRGIGGLHALAVTGMTETVSPASVLSAGVPVARLDGQVATPELWLRLLSDRLAEQSTRRAPDLIAT